MLAPSLAKAMAVARPMPVRAPVIKTTGLFMVLLLDRWQARNALICRRSVDADLSLVALPTKTL
jgi:hypothetical protein